MDRDGIEQELGRARVTFRGLAEKATAADLRRRSNGTRWTNRQLLFHMVFGYLIVRTLMPLVRTLGRLGWSRRFAVGLNAVRGPFHLINYLGSVGGGELLTPSAMAGLLDRTTGVLQTRLGTETDASLALAMHFPPAWDPYFQPTMTVLDLYHYGTLHFDHHRHQLSYGPPTPAA
jgi:hypothetical protein